MTSIDEKLLNMIRNVNVGSSGSSGGSVEVTNPFKDKWVSILGDNTSAYTGWVPEGNESLYPFQDVNDVSIMWWHKLLTRLGAKLCVNESLKDRKVSETTDTNIAVKSVVNKLHREVGKTYININGTTEVCTQRQDPDVILILLGINDFTSDVGIGESLIVKCGESRYNTASFMESYENMIFDVIENYKNSKIYCLNIIDSFNPYSFGGINTARSRLFDYRDAINKLTDCYGIYYIHVNRIGINKYNSKDYLMENTIPNAVCMDKVANQCYNEMMASNNF